jgi:hypothetical protein
MTWIDAGGIGALVSLLTVLANVWIGKSSKKKAGAEATAVIEEAAGKLVARVVAENERLTDRVCTLELRVEEGNHCQNSLSERLEYVEGENKILRRGLGILIQQLEREGCKPAWQLPENVE